MEWFTPERRLTIYRTAASLAAAAIALGALTQGTADEVLIVLNKVLDTVAAVAALAAPLLAAKHVTKK